MINTHDAELTSEESILIVAERLFLSRGFALTTTTQIAQEVGCNQALIHYYFRTKEQLFVRIFEQKARLFASAFFGIDGEGLDFMQKLTLRIGAHFDILAANHRLPFMIINEISTNPNRIDALRETIGEIPRAIIMQFESELQQEINNGRIREITAFDLIINILSLNIGLFITMPILKRVLPGGVDSDLLERRKIEIITTVLNSLKP